MTAAAPLSATVAATSAAGGPRVLIAGGGTGGHVFPALAVAEALVAARPGLEVEFVGTPGGLEATLVPAAGLPLHLVATPPLVRRPSLAAARLPFQLAAAVRAARRLVVAREGGVALAFGGYTSVPLALAAPRAGVPLVVHEQNAVAGVANRLAARHAAAVALAFDEARGRVRTRGRVVVTGNPVRPALARLDRAAARGEAMAMFGLDPARRTLLVFGGSQGARRINDAVVGARWPDPSAVQVLHAAGRRDAERVAAAWAEQGQQGVLVRCEPFLERMDLAYAAADAVVARAGASTLAELTLLGLPAVLVPYPHATDDHQHANAAAVSRLGAARVVDDAELDAVALVAAAAPLLLDDVVRLRTSAAAAAAGRPDAANAVADLVLDVLDGGGR